MIKHRVYIPIYGCYLTIIVAEEFEKAVALYDTSESNYKATDAVVITIIDKKTAIKENIYIQRPQITYGEIAHEAKHIVNRIFQDKSIELDRFNDEAECYLLSYIVDKIIENINKK